MREYGVILAARLGSQRLPGKALLSLQGIPMISFLIRRLKTAKMISRIILATTMLPADDRLEDIAGQEGIDFFRGEENDVVARFVGAADAFDLEYVVRVTGDCPFVDGTSLDFCLEQCNSHESFDIASTKKRFPVGIDYEIYSSQSMRKLHTESLSLDEREHLTLGMYNRPEQYKTIPLFPPADWPKTDIEFTVDTKEDYLFAQELTTSFKSILFSAPELIACAQKLQK